MRQETSDIATLWSPHYKRCLPVVVRQMHEWWLDTLERKLAGHPNPVLVVLGSGGAVLPYPCVYKDGHYGPTNRDRMKRIIQNGRMLFMDYVYEVEEGGILAGMQQMERYHFIGDRYFSSKGQITSLPIDPRKMDDSSFGFFLGDLRDKVLGLVDESVTAIDATLSIHHATPTLQDFEDIAFEIFRVLQPGGFFHLGEGQVDMSYAERKMVRIGRDLAELLGCYVLMHDRRDPKYPKFAIFNPEKVYDPRKDRLPVCSEKKIDEIPHNQMWVTVNVLGEEGEAYVHIKGSKPREMKLYDYKGGTVKFMKDLQSKHGYTHRRASPLGGDFPLIGSHEEDAPMQQSIAKYYDRILGMVAGHPAFDGDIVFEERFRHAVEHERIYAGLGLSEHYIGFDRIIPILRDIGFFVDKNSHVLHNPSPFHSLVVSKPQ